MQIADSFVCFYISDICHPELTGCRRRKIPNQVRILMEAVIGIGGMPSAFRRKHQVMSVQQLIETVPSNHSFSVDILQDQKQFIASNPWCLGTDFTYRFQYTLFKLLSFCYTGL